MADWTEIQACRGLMTHKASCVWPDHAWERFEAQLDYPDRSELLQITILCIHCGRTPTEAMAALPVVMPETIAYPEPTKKRG